MDRAGVGSKTNGPRERPDCQGATSVSHRGTFKALYMRKYSCGEQARERLTSYRGRMTIKICWQIEGKDDVVRSATKDCGLVPIMVRVSQIPLPEICLLILLVLQVRSL
jgi:DNA-directed RNA polymerase beta subunit